MFQFAWGQRGAGQQGVWQDAAASGNLGRGVQSAIGNAFQVERYVDSNGRGYVYGTNNQAGGSFFVIGQATPGGLWLVPSLPFNTFPETLQPGASTSKLTPSPTPGCAFRVAWCAGASLYYCDTSLTQQGDYLSLQWASDLGQPRQ